MVENSKKIINFNLPSELYKYTPITVHEALIMLAAVAPENRFTFDEIQSIIKKHAPHLDARNKIIKQALTDLNFTRRRLKNEQGKRTYYWIKPIDSLQIFTRQTKGLEPQDTNSNNPNFVYDFGSLLCFKTIDYRPFILDFQISILRKILGHEREYLIDTMRKLRNEYYQVNKLHERTRNFY